MGILSLNHLFATCLGLLRMGRAACCSKDAEIKRGAWTAQEDFILKEYITKHGDVGWRSLPQKAGLKRCGKSCRLRWLNYLRSDINHGKFSPDEEELIVRLHRLLGNRWSLIAGRLPGRTDNQIKNHWNTHLSKKVKGEKITLPCPLTRSKPAPPVIHHELISNPVKAKAVRVAKRPNNSESNGNSNHQDLGSIVGRTGESQSTSIESNRHSSSSSSSVQLKEMCAPKFDLFESRSGNDIVDTSMQQDETFTVINEEEWVKPYNESRVVDWLDELQDLQRSSTQWLSVLMLESDDDLQFL